MKRRTSFVALILLLGGCQTTNSEAWSTKAESRFNDPPQLNVSPDEAYLAASSAVLRSAALDLLFQAAESRNPLLRANAIEAMHAAPGEIEAVVQQALADDNRGVRFVAAMSVGRLQLTSLAHLLEPLLHDDSESVQAAAIFALSRCGRDIDPTPLGRMINSSDPEVKGNAALVLGEMGDRSAITMLKSAVGRGMEMVEVSRARVVDIQLAEAMVKLGELSEIEVIRAALFAPPQHGEIKALACMMAGQLQDAGAVPNLLDLATRTGRRQEADEVRLAAIGAVGRIDPSRAPLGLALSYTENDRYQVRALAARALGSIGDPSALPALAGMLRDPNPLVQVSAGGAILLVSQAMDN